MIGRTLSHYRIVDKIGEGAMGVVYRAVDTRLDRPVALKTLPSEAVRDPERRRRFEQEARAASALNHPNIVTIYDIGSDQGVEFIAMEFIRGRTLAELIGRKGMSVADTLKHGAQIADALAAAHAAGIIHRDLKPANIMVNEHGLVKVLDFGVAKLADALWNDPRAPTRSLRLAPASRTLQGTVVGTIAYMSPEQAEGKPVDGRSDIFSLGSVLYEMVTGRRAFRGDSPAAILSAILRDEPPSASQLVVGLPWELETIVTRCLRKEPERRFQGAAELKVVLQEMADTTRLEALARKPPRRRRLLWAAAALAAAALAVLATPAARDRVAEWVSVRQIPAQKHIAVLPFQNIGGEPAHQPFCDGLAETLASKLAQLEQFHGSLWVVPASEVRREGIAGVREAQRMFGVNLVVTGSVQRAGDRVLLTANLVDARTMRQLGARSLDTPLEDLAALQNGVVREVAGLLELELRPGAYDLYLQGRGNLLRYDRAGNLEAAAGAFERALAQDPGYALAHAGLAETYVRRFQQSKEPRWLDEAAASARRALEQNERLATAYVSLGVAEAARERHDVAILQFFRALEIDPVNADAYRELANVYLASGRAQDAEQTYKRALQLRPSDWVGFSALGIFYYRQSRLAEAEAAFRRVTELTPDNSVGYRNLGAIYHAQGRFEEAARLSEKSLDLKPNPIAYSNLGTSYYFQGRYRDAVTANEKAIMLADSGYANDYVMWSNLGDSYRWTPELADKAAGAYRRAIQASERHLELNPRDSRVLGVRATCRAKMADNRGALEEIARARQIAPKDRAVLYRSAVVYELTNQRSRALEALREALQAGYPIEEVRREPELAQLRADPGYERINAALAAGSQARQP